MAHTDVVVTKRPRVGAKAPARGSIVVWALAVAMASSGIGPVVFAGDGASEALELRLYAERAIEHERAAGRAPMADVMTDLLPGLLVEYLSSRDESIAMDVVDSAFVAQQVQVAQLMEQPGLAWALDVFAGPGTGYENNLRTSISNLAEFHHEPTDRQEARMERASDAAVDAYERQLDRHVDRLDKAQETLEKVQDRQMEAENDRIERTVDQKKAFEKAFDRAEPTAQRGSQDIEKSTTRLVQAEDKAARVAEKAQQSVDKVAAKAEEKAEEKTEKAVEKVEQKAEEKVEKVVEKVEQVAEKVEQKAVEKVEQAAEKAEQKAEDQADKAADKSQEKSEQAADTGADKSAEKSSDKSDSGKSDKADKGKSKK